MARTLKQAGTCNSIKTPWIKLQKGLMLHGCRFQSWTHNMLLLCAQVVPAASRVRVECAGSSPLPCICFTPARPPHHTPPIHHTHIRIFSHPILVSCLLLKLWATLPTWPTYPAVPLSTRGTPAAIHNLFTCLLASMLSKPLSTKSKDLKKSRLNLASLMLACK